MSYQLFTVGATGFQGYVKRRKKDQHRQLFVYEMRSNSGDNRLHSYECISNDQL